MEESARKNHADMDGPEGAGRGAVSPARRRAWTSHLPAARALDLHRRLPLLRQRRRHRRRRCWRPLGSAAGQRQRQGGAPRPWRSKCRGGAVWSASVALGTAVDVTGGPAVQLGLANGNKLRLQLRRSDLVGPGGRLRCAAQTYVGTSRVGTVSAFVGSVGSGSNQPRKVRFLFQDASLCMARFMEPWFVCLEREKRKHTLSVRTAQFDTILNEPPAIITQMRVNTCLPESVPHIIPHLET